VFLRPPPFELLINMSLILTVEEAKVHKTKRAMLAKPRSFSWPPKRMRWPRSWTSSNMHLIRDDFK